MTEKLKQKFREEIKKMPKEIQDSVNSFEWGTISEEIGKKYLATNNEANDLQIEIVLILIGITSINDLKINIENNIVISKNYAEKIGDELLEKIFVPITNKITENIKRNFKNRSTTWQQNLNFIVSGGNYIAFIEEINNTENTPNSSSKTSKETLLVNFLKKQ